MSTIDLNKSFGAFLIGTVFSSALYGVTCSQIFYYFQNYSSDGIFIKGVVILLLLCETFHSIVNIHALYYYTILNYMNPDALTKATWSAIMTIEISGIIMLIVHIFYARRVYYISRKNIPLVALIVGPAVAHYGTSTAVAVRTFQVKFFKKLIENPALVESGLVLAAIADITVAASLAYYLHAGRSGIKRTDTVINRLMIHAINNGILTSVFDIIVLGFEARQPDNLIFLSIYQIVGNLYTNSMIATLNSRDHFKQPLLAAPVTSNQQMTTFMIAEAESVAEVEDGSGYTTNETRNETKHFPIRITKEVDVV